MEPKGPLLTLMIVGVMISQGFDAQAQFVCPEASTEEQTTRLAGETFSEGERLFAAEEFRAAIERFECSYALRRHPNTLFNIARAAEELRDWPLARSTYMNLIERYPESDAVEESEERLSIAEAFLIHEEGLDSETQQEGAQDSEPDDEGADAPQPISSRGRMSGPRIGAWATLGLGLVMTITGTALYGTAWSVYNAIPASVERGQDPLQYQEDIDRGEALEASGVALMVTGLASLVVSVVLFTVFEGRVREPTGGGWPRQRREE